MPILWAELADETFRPGLADWDVRVSDLYSVHCMLAPMEDSRDFDYLIGQTFRNMWTPSSGCERPPITTRDVTEAIIKRDWPELRKPPSIYELPPDTMLNMTGGGSPRDFFRDSPKRQKAPKASILSKITKKYGKPK
jgi:hypothetical protein